MILLVPGVCPALPVPTHRPDLPILLFLLLPLLRFPVTLLLLTTVLFAGMKRVIVLC